MAARYTSVLPEPVTPSSTTTPPSPASRAARIAPSARRWPSVSSAAERRGAAALDSTAPPAPRTRLLRSTETTPFFARRATTAETPGTSSASSTWRWGPPRSAASTARSLRALARGT